MDKLTKEHRSWNMGRIKGKNTRPELLVRAVLHRLGFRFRLHLKELPGTPDIVLPKYKTVIFVHGCYWHRHENCKGCTTPKSNTGFWKNKFSRTVERDKFNQQSLRDAGWVVIVLWECNIKKDPVLAVINALIETSILEDDFPYLTMSSRNDKI